MDEPTCGKGLAEHSAVPAKIAELLKALAENLEQHMPSLDLDDNNARQEHDAYSKLSREYRKVATQLEATASAMAGYRDLPMGQHDMQVLSGPEVFESFKNFVRIERELLSLLKDRTDGFE